MAEGNIFIRCPGCGRAQCVGMAVGQQLQCPVCQTVFFAPVSETLMPETLVPEAPVSEAPVSETGQPPPPAKPAKPGGTAARPPGTGTGPCAGERAPGARNWRTDGLPVEMPAARETPGAWQRDGALRTVPAGEPCEPDVAPRGGMIWTVITVVACLLVVVASVPVGIHFVRTRQQAAPTAAEPDPPAVPPAEMPQFRWTDAAHRAQRLGQLEVKVVRARYGAVRARDVNNEVITTDDSNLLAITVRVHNRGAQPHPYCSWYAGSVGDAEGAALLPQLQDDAGRLYDLVRFDDVSSVEGQQLADEIAPHDDVQDTVVFLVPADVDRAGIRCFRLSLPAHAIGAADYFRFEIPVEMVEDF